MRIHDSRNPPRKHRGTGEGGQDRPNQCLESGLQSQISPPCAVTRSIHSFVPSKRRAVDRISPFGRVSIPISIPNPISNRDSASPSFRDYVQNNSFHISGVLKNLSKNLPSAAPRSGNVLDFARSRRSSSPCQLAPKWQRFPGGRAARKGDVRVGYPVPEKGNLMPNGFSIFEDSGTGMDFV